MRKFNTESFFWIATTQQVMQATFDLGSDDLLSAKDRAELDDVFQQMAKTCDVVELKFTKKYVGHIIHALKESDSDLKRGDFCSMLHQLRDRMADELGDKIFIHVNNVKYFEEKNLFGEAVSNKFPKLTLKR